MWLGLIVGTVSLILLVHTLRGPRWHRWPHPYGCGPGWAHGCGAPPWRHRMLWGVLSRLDTTPGQEKAIVQALGELRATVHDLHPSVRGARKQLSQAIAGPIFDAAAWTLAEETIHKAGEQARAALRTALEKVHATLDDRQRQRLATLVDGGPFCG
jgi:hypothetical protein